MCQLNRVFAGYKLMTVWRLRVQKKDELTLEVTREMTTD